MSHRYSVRSAGQWRPAAFATNPVAVLVAGLVTGLVTGLATGLAGCLNVDEDTDSTGGSSLLEPVALTATCEGPRFFEYPLGGRVVPASVEVVNHNYHAYNIGGGVVLEDLDGDGWLDIAHVDSDHQLQLFYGGPNGLEHGLGPAPIGTAEKAIALSTADLDGDGLMELLVMRRRQLQLLHQAEVRHFVDVTAESGLDPTLTYAAASWGDVDRDGQLDLLLVSTPDDFSIRVEGSGRSQHFLYRGQADRLAFVPAGGPELHADLALGSSLAAAIIDLDLDGWLDLVVTQEFGREFGGTRVLKNLGLDGHGQVEFAMVASDTLREGPLAPMGIAVNFEIDNPLPHLALSNLWAAHPSREVWLENQGTPEPAFIDRAEKLNAFAMGQAQHRYASWGLVAPDIDNDGDQDLFIVYGQLQPTNELTFGPKIYPPASPGQPDALLLRETSGYIESPLHCRQDITAGRGVSVGDVNRDGCLDLLVADMHGGLTLLENRCAQPQHHWFGVQLHAASGRAEPVGAQVKVTTAGRSQYRQWLACAEGAHGCLPRKLHIGLGSSAMVDVLEIRWPSGCVTHHTQLPADSEQHFHEPADCRPN